MKYRNHINEARNEVTLKEVAYYSNEKIDTQNINVNNYVSTENLLSDFGGKKEASGLPKTKSVTKYDNKDVLVSNIRPYFKKVWFASENGGASNDVLVIKSKPNIEKPFLYYCLANENFIDYVMSGAKGTKMPRGDKNHILSFNLRLPPSKEQKAIANILSKLDEKIEVNNQINDTFENMAQELFKRWFIDFEFPNAIGDPYQSSGGEMVESELGIIPKGWRVGKLGNIVNVKSGYAFKSSWWKEYGVPVIKIKNIKNESINFEDISYVEEKYTQMAEEFLVTSGDLVIAMTGATLGKIGIVPISNSPILVNQRVGKFFMGADPLNKLPFVYCLLKTSRMEEEVINRGGGSAQSNISPNGLKTISVTIPSDEILNDYNMMMKSIFQKMITNIAEIDTLIRLRDTLLPKLMSGEILVPLEETEEVKAGMKGG